LILQSLLIGSPMLLGMFGCSIGGYLTDWYLKKTGDRKKARTIFGFYGYAGASLFYGLAIVALATGQSIWLFASCIALAGFCNDLTMSSCWAICQDVGRKYAAMVSGCMNMIGNFGSILTILLTGRIVKHYETIGDKNTGYMICLGMYAFAYFCGCYFWTRIDPMKPIIPEPEDSVATKT
jgi:MFS transporter, ACS family, glucarate transporter